MSTKAKTTTLAATKKKTTSGVKRPRKPKAPVASGTSAATAPKKKPAPKKAAVLSPSKNISSIGKEKPRNGLDRVGDWYLAEFEDHCNNFYSMPAESLEAAIECVKCVKEHVNDYGGNKQKILESLDEAKTAFKARLLELKNN